MPVVLVADLIPSQWYSKTQLVEAARVRKTCKKYAYRFAWCWRWDSVGNALLGRRRLASNFNSAPSFLPANNWER
jgi:hypothetical protein